MATFAQQATNKVYNLLLAIHCPLDGTITEEHKKKYQDTLNEMLNNGEVSRQQIIEIVKGIKTIQLKEL